MIAVPACKLLCMMLLSFYGAWCLGANLAKAWK